MEDGTFVQNVPGKFGGVSDLAWSSDGRNVAVSFPSDALMLESENPVHIHRMRGKDLSWVFNNRGIYCRENAVDDYVEIGSWGAEPMLSPFRRNSAASSGRSPYFP